MSARQQVRAMFDAGVHLVGKCGGSHVRITSIDDDRADGPVAVTASDKSIGRYTYGEVLGYFHPVLEAGQTWAGDGRAAVILAVTETEVLCLSDGNYDEHTITVFRRLFHAGFVGLSELTCQSREAAQRWLTGLHGPQIHRALRDLVREFSALNDDPGIIRRESLGELLATMNTRNNATKDDITELPRLPKALDAAADELVDAKIDARDRRSLIALARSMSDKVRTAMDLMCSDRLAKDHFDVVIGCACIVLAQCQTLLSTGMALNGAREGYGFQLQLPGRRGTPVSPVLESCSRARDRAGEALCKRLQAKPLPPLSPFPPDPVCIDNSFWEDGFEGVADETANRILTW